MKKLVVDLGNRSYPIYIKKGLLTQSEFYRDYLNNRNYLIVTNTTLFSYYESLLRELVDNDLSRLLILEDGEQYKNQESLFTILTKLLKLEANRSSLLVAFGGGVIGDLVGLAASIYQRGIDFIQIPTTLLAQVDSSVGGKTAINHPLGKNMIGSFYQPKGVFIDPELLKTLSKREFISGLAEVVKYGFIQDISYLEWLIKHADGILNLEYDLLEELIFRSCEAKSEIVRLDEKESGIRAILNLGHTFGHAIERGYNYKDILHGEAVSIGIKMAAHLSHSLENITGDEYQEIVNALIQLRLPIKCDKELTVEEMLSAMRLDKKNISGTIRFVLFDQIGKAKIVDNVPEELVKEAILSGI